MLPSSLVVAGAFARAVRATDANCDEAACLLRGSTARRALAGIGHPRQWCCPINAIARALVADRLVDLGDVVLDASVLLFLLGAREALRWDLVAPMTRLPARAHVRTFTLELAARVGLLIGTTGTANSPVVAPDPAWADPTRHAEPLKDLLARLPAPWTIKSISEASSISERSLGCWRRGEARPGRENLDRLVRYLHRMGVATDAMTLLRSLDWHYALAELADVLSDAFDRPFAKDLASTFTRVAIGAAHRTNQGLQTLPIATQQRVAPFATLFDVLAEQVLLLAEMHAPAWRDDVLAVQIEREQIPGFLQIRTPSDVADLCDLLPRKQKLVASSTG